jgi:ribosome recycling factor
VIDDIKQDANVRMGKSLEALIHAFSRIRTGRANPAILEGIEVQYYGTDTPLNQVASISVEDARTLVISAWRRICCRKSKGRSEKCARYRAGDRSGVIRIPLPPLSEENRLISPNKQNRKPSRRG